MTAPPNPIPAAAEPRLWVTNPAKASLLGWLFRYYVFAALVVLWATLAAGVGLYRYFAADLPPLAEITAYASTAPGVTRIHAADGTLLAELAREHRAYAGYEDIPEELTQAFIATEDRRFFTHGGLDYRGLARAIVANLRSGGVVQGGSTITQQVAKGFLTRDRTLSRKVREAILSVRLENRLSKEQILEVYMNKIFLGHNAYGVGAAASRYFDKSLGELTLGECALIAGLARAPSHYSPVASPARAVKRKSVVLQNMVSAGYITKAQRDQAELEPIELVRSPDVFRQRAPHYAEVVRQQLEQELGEDALLTQGLQIETALDLTAQAAGAEAVDRALRKMDRRQGWRGPVAHLPEPSARDTFLERTRARYGTTALSDPTRWYLGLVTDTARREVTVHVADRIARLPLRHMAWAAAYDRNTGVNDQRITNAEDALVSGDVVWVQPDAAHEPTPSKPDPLVKLGQTPRVEASLYTFEHDTGYVVAMQGGHDYDRSQFNRPTQACRQPGSVFKAIYYALALDTGRYTMATELEDKPYEPEPGEEWNPQNIHGTLEGKVLLRNAFIYSLNLPSIRLFQQLGATAVVKFARTLGFTTELIADKALSLGASCVRTDELSRAFAVFVRGGTWLDAVYVRRAVDKTGKTVIDNRHPFDPSMDVAGRLDRMAALAADPPAQVVDSQTSYLITRMMRDVVTTGIGGRAQRIGVPAGGKSGTASKNEYTTDTWFVGFTSRFVAAAWMGDDRYERSLGDEDASYTTATPMWTDYMKTVVDGVAHHKLPLDKPVGIHSLTVDARTGSEPITGLPVATLFFKTGT